MGGRGRHWCLGCGWRGFCHGYEQRCRSSDDRGAVIHQLGRDGVGAGAHAQAVPAGAETLHRAHAGDADGDAAEPLRSLHVVDLVLDERQGAGGGVAAENDNGRVDRQWDRNRDGNLDRRWDRNNNERLDRRYDRNRDGNLDRRYDRDRDGVANRYDRRDGRSWNRSWRNDRRYDWHRHREYNRDYYRQGRYYAPYRNHRYSRFSIGIRIGSPFYSDRYWINDPWRYRLPDVHGPYRWVRYYDDVLLVDVYSGEVVDVIHNFFW
ncbi:MAG: hypothetical protein HC788_10140 [Sphingopyxis sp.]|nr:hypothetical protein [Sphingopyxis sp.]